MSPFEKQQNILEVKDSKHQKLSLDGLKKKKQKKDQAAINYTDAEGIQSTIHEGLYADPSLINFLNENECSPANT